MPARPPSDPPMGPPPVTHCPGCGTKLGGQAAFVQEFWAAADRNFLCWCPSCRLMCTVVIGDRLVSHEPWH
jgi:hypothetical protein